MFRPVRAHDGKTKIPIRKPVDRQLITPPMLPKKPDVPRSCINRRDSHCIAEGRLWTKPAQDRSWPGTP